MKNRIRTMVAGTAAALFVTAAPLAAQEAISEANVADFFDKMDQNVTEAVQAENFEALLQWTQDHIADEAVLSATNEVTMGGERKSFAVVSLTKQDMLRLGRMATGMLSGMQGDALQDYSLEIAVSRVTPIGSDAATVDVQYTETATLSAPQGAATADAGDADTMQTAATDTEAEVETADVEAAAAEAVDEATDAAPVEAMPADEAGGQALKVTGTANCTHLVRRGEGGELMIGLSTCEARTAL